MKTTHMTWYISGKVWGFRKCRDESEATSGFLVRHKADLRKCEWNQENLETILSNKSSRKFAYSCENGNKDVVSEFFGD